jgi:hypothetical protein
MGERGHGGQGREGAAMDRWSIVRALVWLLEECAEHDKDSDHRTSKECIELASKVVAALLAKQDEKVK